MLKKIIQGIRSRSGEKKSEGEVGVSSPVARPKVLNFSKRTPRFSSASRLWDKKLPTPTIANKKPSPRTPSSAEKLGTPTLLTDSTNVQCDKIKMLFEENSALRKLVAELKMQLSNVAGQPDKWWKKRGANR